METRGDCRERKEKAPSLCFMSNKTVKEHPTRLKGEPKKGNYEPYDSYLNHPYEV